jgi:peptidoglycan/xylan/chitin deacetylase (PgdA/CDA1 family)
MKLVTLFLFVFLLTGCGTAIVSPTSPTPRSSPSTSGGVVSLNFDDGCESAYVHGLPIIEAAGFKTTQFIITKRLGEPGFLTTGQVLAMQNSGHEIGAHTRTHPNLSTLTAAQQQDEIEGSLTDLEAIGVTPTSFAYPYGAYNDTTLSIVEKAGFLSARGTKRGFNDASANRLLLNGWILGPEGINDLNRITQAIDDAQTNGTWLILIFHRIDETGEATSIPHEMLQEIVDHLVEQKTNVVTTREALNIYGLK